MEKWYNSKERKIVLVLLVIISLVGYGLAVAFFCRMKPAEAISCCAFGMLANFALVFV